jgi:hypothetical protein
MSEEEPVRICEFYSYRSEPCQMKAVGDSHYCKKHTQLKIKMKKCLFEEDGKRCDTMTRSKYGYCRDHVKFAVKHIKIKGDLDDYSVEDLAKLMDAFGPFGNNKEVARLKRVVNSTLLQKASKPLSPKLNDAPKAPEHKTDVPVLDTATKTEDPESEDDIKEECLSVTSSQDGEDNLSRVTPDNESEDDNEDNDIDPYV